jgi:hypothetical protein
MSPVRDVTLLQDLFKRFNTCLPAGRSSNCSIGYLKAHQQNPNKQRQTPNAKQKINHKPAQRFKPLIQHSEFNQTITSHQATKHNQSPPSGD